MEHRANVSSDFLAAERTFLGWIRTGLALMGFGFVVARFGLFVQELQFAYPDLPVRGPSRSVPLIAMRSTRKLPTVSAKA